MQNFDNNIAIEEHLDKFCLLDDYDVMGTIKNWVFHEDKVLSYLCKNLVDRKLLKAKLQAEPFDENEVQVLKNNICKQLNIFRRRSKLFCFYRRNNKHQRTIHQMKE